LLEIDFSKGRFGIAIVNLLMIFLLSFVLYIVAFTMIMSFENRNISSLISAQDVFFLLKCVFTKILNIQDDKSTAYEYRR